MSGATADQVVDQRRDQDLSRRRRVTQSTCEHDRSPEVVGFIADRLADMQTDADLERIVMSFWVVANGMLDRNRRRERIEGGGEDDHEPVTEVLDLFAAVLPDDAP